MQLKCKTTRINGSLTQTPNSSFLPDDVTVEYNKMKMCYEKLMGCSSTVQFTTRLDLHTKTTAFESQSGNGRKRVQVPTSVTMLTPEIDREFTTHNRKPTYRLQCPKAGLFQCSSTGLVFLMEGKGDVLYMMTQWDSSLLGSRIPAGPLFSIECPEQSVRQLHFPHCICDWENDILSVAHVTDGNMEIVQPLKTTATHVEHQQKGSTFIKSSSNCTLSPRGTYGLCCELVANSRIQPKSGQFDYDYSPNFHPTFQVFLDCISGAENIRLSLLDRGSNDQRVWECLVPADFVPPQVNPINPNPDFVPPQVNPINPNPDFVPPQVNPINPNPGAEAELNQLTDAAFVDKHMADLIQRVKMVQHVADDLVMEEVIQDELYSRICSADNTEKQIRLMFDAVQAGGTRVKSAFYKALQNHEPRLVQDLGKIKLF
ncbi:hypothetical protein J4Q44_G00384550 [Coregonus suidteri]|uniref:CARD domain-containing protein n=1 Tax=Coregonus suidteri TaxID=861788 RepID=A0AAN8KR53_9TELE